MKRLKKTELKKLTVELSTIRILSDVEQQQVAGGRSAGCSDVENCVVRTQTCSIQQPGCP